MSNTEGDGARQTERTTHDDKHVSAGEERVCPACGEWIGLCDGVCKYCGLNRTRYSTLVDERSDEILFVGGSGYGVGGAYSDTFHALKPGLDESVCGRLDETNSGAGGAETGLNWVAGVMTMDATERWQ